MTNRIETLTNTLSAYVTAAVFCATAASPADAALITWDEPAVAISTVGDTIVSTDGLLVEAINYSTSAAPRTVNTVGFTAQTTGPSGWNNPFSNSSIYTGGSVGTDFAAILDSFAFGDTPGNPGTETLTLGTFNSLNVGQSYFVQLFVSDDRTTALQNRQQDYTGGGNTSALYANGLSYSLTGTFIADAATQNISFRVFPPSGSASPIINAFQVRQLVPEPSTLWLLAVAFVVLVLTRQCWAKKARY